jgi:metallophosphoesterase superfamily enzyme
MSPSIRTFEIREGLRLVAPYPVAYLEGERALVVSDLHLGAGATLGFQFVADAFHDVVEPIISPASSLRCEKVFILGDLKHGFGRPLKSELLAIERLVKKVRAAGAEPVLVRGNHDLFLDPCLERLGVTCVEEYVILQGRFLLTHGHRKVIPRDGVKDEGGEKNVNGDAALCKEETKQTRSKIDCIIIGHEHPAISLADEFGVRRSTFKTFLYLEEEEGEQEEEEGGSLIRNARRFAKGTSGRANTVCARRRSHSASGVSHPALLVLPSVNPLSYGTDVLGMATTNGRRGFLSPYLRERSKKNLMRALPYVLEVGEMLLPFPRLGNLRSL